MSTKAKKNADENVETPNVSIETAPKESSKGMMIARKDFAAYKVIREEGKFKVPVSNVSKRLPMLDASGDQVYDANGDPLHKYIINLKAIPPHNLEIVKEIWKGQQEINIASLNGLTMSTNQVDNGNDFALPARGEKIEIIVEKRFSNRAGEDVLAVVQHIIPKAANAEDFSFDDEDEIAEQIEE